jgi:hypothetical protein
MDDVDCSQTCFSFQSYNGTGYQSLTFCYNYQSSFLSGCAFRGNNTWGSNDCAHYEDVGVSCFMAPLPSSSLPAPVPAISGISSPSWSSVAPAGIEGAVRLTGGAGPWEGRLEIYHDNQWGTVCDDGWSEANTRAACSMLGYPGAQG